MIRSRQPGFRSTRTVALAALVASFVGIAAVALKLSRALSSRSSTAVAAPARAAQPARAIRVKQSAPRSPGFTHYPTIPALRAAFYYAAARAGDTSYAVLDSAGKLTGYDYHRTFTSASITKAMLLVTYLHDLGSKHQTLDSGGEALLYPMIHNSDNTAATRVEGSVGDSAIRHIAHLAGMTDFSFGHDWANEQVSAADEVHLFAKLDSLIPTRYLQYARGLLSGITASESWGIPAVARPAWNVYFKGGWRRTGAGQLVNQAAWLERNGISFELAVMTDGDPSQAYGIETVRGVTARVLAPGGRGARPPARLPARPPRPAAQLPGRR